MKPVAWVRRLATRVWVSDLNFHVCWLPFM